MQIANDIRKCVWTLNTAINVASHRAFNGEWWRMKRNTMPETSNLRAGAVSPFVTAMCRRSKRVTSAKRVNCILPFFVSCISRHSGGLVQRPTRRNCHLFLWFLLPLFRCFAVQGVGCARAPLPDASRIHIANRRCSACIRQTEKIDLINRRKKRHKSCVQLSTHFARVHSAHSRNNRLIDGERGKTERERKKSDFGRKAICAFWWNEPCHLSSHRRQNHGVAATALTPAIFFPSPLRWIVAAPNRECRHLRRHLHGTRSIGDCCNWRKRKTMRLLAIVWVNTK